MFIGIDNFSPLAIALEAFTSTITVDGDERGEIEEAAICEWIERNSVDLADAPGLFRLDPRMLALQCLFEEEDREAALKHAAEQIVKLAKAQYGQYLHHIDVDLLIEAKVQDAIEMVRLEMASITQDEIDSF